MLPLGSLDACVIGFVSTAADMDDEKMQFMSRKARADVAAVQRVLGAVDPVAERLVLRKVPLIAGEPSPPSDESELGRSLIEFYRQRYLEAATNATSALYSGAGLSTSTIRDALSVLMMGGALGTPRLAWWIPPTHDRARYMSKLQLAWSRAKTEECTAYAHLPLHQTPSSFRFVRYLLGQRAFDVEMRGISKHKTFTTVRHVFTREASDRLRILVRERHHLSSARLRGHQLAFKCHDAAIAEQLHLHFAEPFHLTRLMLPSIWDSPRSVQFGGADRPVLEVHVLYDPSGGGLASDAVIVSGYMLPTRRTWTTGIARGTLTLKTLDEMIRLDADPNPIIATMVDILPRAHATDSPFVARSILRHMDMFMRRFNPNNSMRVMFTVHIEMNMMAMHNTLPQDIVTIALQDSSERTQYALYERGSSGTYRRDDIDKLYEHFVFEHGLNGNIISSGGAIEDWRHREWSAAQLDLFIAERDTKLLPCVASVNAATVAHVSVAHVGFVTDARLKNAGFTCLQTAVNSGNFVMHPHFCSNVQSDLDHEVIAPMLSQFERVRMDFFDNVKKQLAAGSERAIQPLHIPDGGAIASGFHIKPIYVYGKSVDRGFKDDIVNAWALLAAKMHARYKERIVYDFLLSSRLAGIQ